MNWHVPYQRLLQRSFLPAVFVLLAGCNSGSDEINPRPVPEQKALFLEEYWEDGEIALQFTYEDTLLISHTIYDARRDRIFKFELSYNNFNHKPYNMSAKVDDRVFQRQFDYNSTGRVLGYTFFVDRYIRYFIRLFYNESDQIVKSHQYWPLNGLLETKTYQWENGNVTRIESWNNFIVKSNPLVVEYKYDEKNNPYTTIFETIGFNVIEDMPLTANNPIELKMYWKETPEINEAHKTKYAYGFNNYPFVKETAIKDAYGNKRVVYGEFIY